MRTEFRFAVFETTPPYALVVVGLGPEALALTEKNPFRHRALASMPRCRRVAGVSDADVLVRLAAGVRGNPVAHEGAQGVTGKSVRARRTRAVE